MVKNVRTYGDDKCNIIQNCLHFRFSYLLKYDNMQWMLPNQSLDKGNTLFRILRIDARVFSFYHIEALKALVDHLTKTRQIFIIKKSQKFE